MASAVLTNSAIAELLALMAENAKQPLQKALRRACSGQGKVVAWPRVGGLQHRYERAA